MTLLVRAATIDDLPGIVADMRAQLPDNGRDGVWFSTVRIEDADVRFSPARLDDMRFAHARAVHEPGWARTFVATDEDRIVGHVDLTGGPVAAMLHRCTLGIGLQAAYRGRGLGRILMLTAIAWAREAGVRWIDLGVMAGNDRAYALYRSLGFVEVGRVADRFRVGETSLTDIVMALALA